MGTATHTSWHTDVPFTFLPHLSLIPRWAPAPERALAKHRRVVGRFRRVTITYAYLNTHEADVIECRRLRRQALLTLRAVRDVTGFSVVDLVEGGRAYALVEARQALWTMLSRQGLSNMTISRMCDRDHSTIISGLRRLDKKPDKARDLIDQVQDRMRVIGVRREPPAPHAYVVPTTDVAAPSPRSLWDALRTRLAVADVSPWDQHAVYDYLRGPLLGLQVVYGTTPAYGLLIIARVAAVYRAVANTLIELGCAPYLSVIGNMARSRFRVVLGTHT